MYIIFPGKYPSKKLKKKQSLIKQGDLDLFLFLFDKHHQSYHSKTNPFISLKKKLSLFSNSHIYTFQIIEHLFIKGAAYFSFNKTKHEIPSDPYLLPFFYLRLWPNSGRRCQLCKRKFYKNGYGYSDEGWRSFIYKYLRAEGQHRQTSFFDSANALFSFTLW